ncbi:ABC transporter ATP-binding protein [Cytobacillus gottheilii]|uniref:ABC transporter ATP-binding protein n=1 Tax=Cytobacillus gottheilii TaxID=859144 RepID=A0ABX8FD13_9BACI|nr:ABC transporter ATP-binding protein [Cytobacillus gottheilii]QVY62176.1 ABC transporter ATP-binding protein [Cytobacillus gottheilii]
MKAVQLKDIRKSYGQNPEVLKGINAAIEPGEFFVLVGPSGCGKSTMLRIIAGLEEVSEGELIIGSETANRLRPNERDLSMVFQNYALFPHLTVEQNIMFGLHVKKIAKSEQIKRCKEAAEMLGISDYLKRKPKELSGGQRQRVALARAIVTHAPICLMDEPLSNLDAKLRARMRSEIRQIQRKLGITMIYVTHDQTEAMTMADRMMILNHGEVQQVGKPLDIYNNPQNTFVASFIGSPPMNLTAAHVNKGKLQIANKWNIKVDGYQDGEVIIGVRPEAILPANDGLPAADVKVANVEVLGTETLVSFELEGNKQWIAKWPGQWSAEIGEILQVSIDHNKIELFDAVTGERLEETHSKKVLEVVL